MAVVARGNVRDRPFARTIYAIAAKRFTGELTMSEGGRSYKVVWRDGHVVAARSASPADSLGRIALTAGLVTSTQVADMVRMSAASPGRSELDILAEVARLAPEQVIKVKRRAMAQCAIRIFSLPDAELVLDTAVTLPVDAEAQPIGVRWLIYQGLHAYYSEERLLGELAAVRGASFRLAGASRELFDQYGFDAAARACLGELEQAPRTLGELASALPDTSQKTLLAVIYALLATDAVVASQPEPGVRRPGTEPEPQQAATGPGPQMRRAPSEPMAGAGAASRSVATQPIQQVRRTRPETVPGVAAAAPSVASQPVQQVRRTRPETVPGVASAAPSVATQPIQQVRRTRPETVPGVALAAPSVTSQSIPQARRAPSEPISGTGAAPRSVATQPIQQVRRTRPETVPGVAAAVPQGVPSQPIPQVARTQNTQKMVMLAQAPEQASPAPGVQAAQHGTAPGKGEAAHERAADPERAADIRALIAGKLEELDAGADHYQLLGVPRGATAAAIRTAYFDLAKKLHPDRLRALDIDDHPADTQRLFAEINLAFAVLGNTKKRTDYDAALHSGAAQKNARQDQSDAESKAARILAAEQVFMRGEMSMRRSQFASARADFEKAVELNPDEAEYHALLAWTTWCAAEDKQAVLAQVKLGFQRAITLSPRGVAAYFHRGQVASGMGDIEVALDCFRKVLELQPSHHEAGLQVRLLENRLSKGEGKKGSEGKKSLFDRLKGK